MATMKHVYFAEDGQWFPTREEAEKHEEMCELVKYLAECGFFGPDAKSIVQALMVRYSFSEDWEYRQLIRQEAEEDKEV
jgi:hypothetical protein